jgi:hypothetical protein
MRRVRAARKTSREWHSPRRAADAPHNHIGLSIDLKTHAVAAATLETRETKAFVFNARQCAQAPDDEPSASISADERRVEQRAEVAFSADSEPQPDSYNRRMTAKRDTSAGVTKPRRVPTVQGETGTLEPSEPRHDE